MSIISNFNPLDLQRASFLNHLLPGITLRDYQTRAAIHIAKTDKQLLAFDTGLGKTVSMVAGLVANRNLHGRSKILFLCPLAGMNQVYKTFKAYTRFNVVKFTGSEAGVKRFYSQIEDGVDVILCNYEAFDNPEVLQVMLQLSNKNFFDIVCLDEAHVVANMYTSNRNFFICTLASKIKKKYFLTATPIISTPAQYATLLAIMLDKLNDYGSVMHRVKAGHYLHHVVPNLVQFKERKVNYEVKLHSTPAIEVPYTLYGTEIFKHTRGKKNKSMEEKLKELILQNKEKLLIFSHLKSNHAYLTSIVEELGLRVGVISGDTNKERVQEQFNSDQLDCVIFSIPTELNLPAKAIILYDWTSLAHQAIGRGIRSESAEGYTAHILLSETSKEVSLFENTVIKNSVYLSETFGKDIKQLLKLK